MSTISATAAESGTEETPLPVLEADLLALASDLAAAECRWLHMVAEFDRREGWAGVGVVSCAHWLSWRCGLSLTTAREKVRVARALVTLPKISASFEKGELSYSRARAIVRAADPDNEELLIDIARHSTGAQLERIVRATVGVQRLEEVQERRSRRTVHWHWDDDGSFVLRARLEPEEGAAVLAALEAAQSRQYSRRQSDKKTADVGKNEGNEGTEANKETEEDEDSRQDRLDEARDNGDPGHGDQAEDAAEHDASGGSRPDTSDSQTNSSTNPPEPVAAPGAAADTTEHGPDGTEHGPHADAAPPLMDADERAATRADALVCVAEAFIAHDAPTAGADVFQVVVHVRDDGPPHLDSGPALLLQTALRMSCDANIYCIHEDARGAVLDVGRTTRRIRRPLRRALWQRDGGCRFPGCGRRRGVDAHHVVHWTKRGPTALANLVLLCRRHHTLVHEGGFDLRMNGQGQPEFRTPSGADLLEFPAAAPSQHPPRHWHRQEVAGNAVDTQWGGEQADVGYVASVICQPAPVRLPEQALDDRAPHDRAPDDEEQAAS